MMKNKRNKLLFSIGLCLIAALFLWWLLSRAPTKPGAIAIFTTLSHPALEQARKAFTQDIRQEFPDLDLLDFNAEGNTQQANLIAQHLTHKENVKAIFTIGTLATQSMLKAEYNKPIVFAAVSDYAALGEGKGNICGLSDAIDATFQIKTIKDLLPQVKSISLLYTPHEQNSSSQVNKLAISARDFGVTTKLFGVHETQQINAATKKACQSADAVLIPLDNQLAAAMPLVIKASSGQKCPVIISDKALLHYGAAMAFGVDYQKIGHEAARMMSEILANKKSPKDIGVENPQELGVYINANVLNQQGLSLNPEHQTKVIEFQNVP